MRIPRSGLRGARVTPESTHLFAKSQSPRRPWPPQPSPSPSPSRSPALCAPAWARCGLRSLYRAPPFVSGPRAPPGLHSLPAPRTWFLQTAVPQEAGRERTPLFMKAWGREGVVTALIPPFPGKHGLVKFLSLVNSSQINSSS